ncbi:MAG: acyl-CoA dehydrogenase family protein [Chloroflexota bacterium]|nr:acyl-CoA dehydrogenase family protein [Chloroflexota bacterium]
MDFSFTPEQEALRKEFDDFFKAEMAKAPEGIGGGLEDMFDTEAGFEFHKYMAKTLAAKGWLVRAWPKEYGGQSAPIIEQLIFSDVAGYNMAPGIDVFGIGMIGPTLLAIGTEEQKKEHLIPISKGERFWCQLWSEPNSGSDLASLSTTAIKDGDDYVLNGQKTWTSGAHRADWGFGIFRSDPASKRSKGLTFMVLDMKSPGLTIRPLLSMGNTHIFNEEFFDNVRVPVKNRIGEEGGGWDVTRTTMNFERSNVGMASMGKRMIEELVQFCKETKLDGEPLANNPFVKHKIAQMYIEIEIARSLAYRIAFAQEKAGDNMFALIQTAGVMSSAKVWGTEMLQRVAYNGLEIFGMYGPVRKGSKYAPLLGAFESLYQFCPGANIFAGSSEVQRNTIAWMTLGMPRSWDEVFKAQRA